MRRDWEKILPTFIHKSSGTTSSILGFIDFIKYDDPEKTKRYCNNIRKGISSLENALQELSILVHDVELDPEQFNLCDLLEDLSSEYAVVKIANQITPAELTIRSDYRLVRMLFDLIFRIIAANSKPGITLNVKIYPGEVRLSCPVFPKKTFEAINGQWGHEREVIDRLLEILAYHFRHERRKQREHFSLIIEERV